MIVPLTEADTAAAVALWQAVGLTRPWNDPAADVALALASPQSTLFAAHDGPTLVGTVMAGVDGHRAWVYYLAVAESARGTGLGRRLMAAAEEWCSGRGVARLNLMVRADNDAVLGFYGQLGYRRSDVAVLQRDLG